MKSLDPVNNTRPMVAKTNPAADQQAAPRPKEPQRRGSTAGFRYSSSSVAAAAAAAATAAANTAAAKKAAVKRAAVPAQATTVLDDTTERSRFAVQSRRAYPPELPVGPGIRNIKGGIHAGDASGGNASVCVASTDNFGGTATSQQLPPAHGDTAVGAAEESREGSRALDRKSSGATGLKAASDADAERIFDPFVSGQKLGCTPVPAATAKAIPVPGVARGCAGGSSSCTTPAEAATEAAETSAALMTAEDEPHANGLPEGEAGCPFASKNKLPRTPVGPISVTQASCDEAACGDRHDSGEVVSKGNEGRVLGPVDVQAAQLQIGELNREVACMADRLAKQTQERNRSDLEARVKLLVL